MAGEPKGGTLRVATCFLVSILASAAFIAAYQFDAGTQWLALTLTIAFGGLGMGLVWWARRLMPTESTEEPRPTLVPAEGEERETADTFRAGTLSIRRRGLLGGLLGAAAAALGLGVISPVRSLGPAPSTGLRATGWRSGVHLVDENAQRVTADALQVGSVLTVFPEGRDPAADDQVVLLRVPPQDLSLPAGREDWTPGGYVAFSKVCTHAGCPVGLYQNVGYLLLCPCHQATFDVVAGAKPVYGPAPRDLPQLPLQVADDGTLMAGGEFSGPVGPDRWRLDRGTG